MNKNWIFVILPMCFLTMGNKGCEKKAETAKARQLKKIVELSPIISPEIDLPNGKKFDFQYVANQQIYGVLAASEQFAVRSTPPVAPQAESKSMFAISESDMKMLQESMSISNQNPDDLQLKTDFSQTAWCMVNLPQFKLEGSVNSFEIIGGGGLTVGFGPGGALDPTGVPELGFYVDYAQMDLSLRALPALGRSLVGAVNVTSQQTKTKISAKFNIGAFALGPEFYYQTPLASVTKKGLQKGIDQLAALKSMKNDTWYTRVMMDHDKYVTIVGGLDVNLEIGDELLIYNEDYAWSGEPCHSEYLGGVGTGQENLYAKIKVVTVGDQLSRAEVVQIFEEYGQLRPQIGAKVKLHKLRETVSPPPSSKNSAKKT